MSRPVAPPSVSRLRQIVREGTRAHLLGTDVRPLMIAHARELLGLIEDRRVRHGQTQYEVQELIGDQWEDVSIPTRDKVRARRTLTWYATRNPTHDYRLVQFVPKVLAFKRGKGTPHG